MNMKPMLLILLILISVTACAVDSKPTYIKNGKEFGTISETFRNRWWNYYERGLSFAQGEYYAEAVEDIRSAMRIRSMDQRMARTYGMHFIDYFPHRELGIIYYHTGELDAAREELELSLRQFPSAKARFYLDEVRKTIIRHSGISDSKPELSFEADEIWTRDCPVIISGVANDANFISEIAIGDRRLFLEGAVDRIRFDESFVLSEGTHAIPISAKNLADRTSQKMLTVHVDRQGPVISIQDIAYAKHESTLSGSVYDTSGLSEFEINGKPISCAMQSEIYFSETFRGSKPAGITLIATDRLGNRTVAGISAEDIENFKYSAFDRQPGTSFLLAASSLDTAYDHSLSFFQSAESLSPVIDMKGWTRIQTVFMNKIFLEGKIRDNGTIVNVTVNGMSIIQNKGKYIFFNHMLDLSEGENIVRIEATDDSGNTSVEELTVILKIPEALRLNERLSVTILPFEQRNDASEYSMTFWDYLIHAMVNQNRFRVIERHRLDVILQEHKLSQTSLMDRDMALKIGKMIAARAILTGSIIRSVDGIEIVARFTDTETSEILATIDVFDKNTDVASLQELAEGMAVKVHREFPILNGQVIRQEHNAIFTDLGVNHIKLQRRLIVYRETQIHHPVTGRLLGTDNTILGHARITQVMPELSKAEILDGDSERIQALDKVITE